MNELDAGGEGDLPFSVVSAKLCRCQGENRPEPLAAGSDEMTGQLRYQRNRAVHVFHDNLIDLYQLIADKAVDGFKAGLSAPPRAV